MQLTTGLITIALAVAGVVAAPKAAIAERQAALPDLVLIQFFTERNCGGRLISSTTFVSNTTDCLLPQPAVEYPSFRPRANFALRQLNIFSNNDCGTTGAQVTIAPGQVDGCYSQPISSARYGPN